MSMTMVEETWYTPITVYQVEAKLSPACWNLIYILLPVLVPLHRLPLCKELEELPSPLYPYM